MRWLAGGWLDPKLEHLKLLAGIYEHGQSSEVLMDCRLLEIALCCEFDVCAVCRFGRDNGIKAEGADLIVLFDLAEDFFGIKVILDVDLLSFVLQAQALGFEVRRAHHPAEHQRHSQHHQLGLSPLVLLALVLGDQEEHDKHMTMGEEHIDPILITFERKLLDFDAVLLLYQQIFEILAELVSGDDGQSINFSPICWDFRHSCLWFGGALF